MKKFYFPLSVLAVFSIIFWLLPSYYSQSEGMQKISLQSRDIFFKVRHATASLPKEIENLVIVSIDDESCERLGARWPWPRKIFAEIIKELHHAGAKVIALNLTFNGFEGDDGAPSLDLAKAMKAHGNVVIGTTMSSDNQIVKPIPLIEDAVSRFGYLEKEVSDDFVVRKSNFLSPATYKIMYGNLRLQSTTENAFISSFPLEMFSASAWPGKSGDAKYDKDLGLVTVGKPSRAVYVEPDGGYTINYLAAEDDFKRIPAWKVVQKKFNSNDVYGKTVIVGVQSELFSESSKTPLGQMSGVGINANEYLSLDSNRLLQLVSDDYTFAIAWIMGVCVLALFLMQSFWVGIIAVIVTVVGISLGVNYKLSDDYLIEPFILALGPMFGAMIGFIANSLKLLFENKGLETKVIHDKMTGLYKYEYLRECLEEEWKRCVRSKLPLSIAMTDLDRFKKINDTLGHEVGNQMIIRAGNVIKDSARRYDIVSRYGGDEFVILLWHSNLEEAKAYRERLRNLYHAMASSLEPALQDSSISIGVASFDPASNPNFPPSPQTLIEEADKDLFLDKESRRKGPSR